MRVFKVCCVSSSNSYWSCQYFLQFSKLLSRFSDWWVVKAFEFTIWWIRGMPGIHFFQTERFLDFGIFDGLEFPYSSEWSRISWFSSFQDERALQPSYICVLELGFCLISIFQYFQSRRRLKVFYLPSSRVSRSNCSIMQLASIQTPSMPY